MARLHTPKAKISRHFPSLDNYLPNFNASKIFEENLHPPHVVEFEFYLYELASLRPGIDIAIGKFPGLLSLLKTCKNSNGAVYRGGFKKIELLLSRAVLVTGKALALCGTVNYTCLRPRVDILMINAESITELYRLGGSIDSLSSFTHIATYKLANGRLVLDTKEEITTLLRNSSIQSRSTARHLSSYT